MAKDYLKDKFDRVPLPNTREISREDAMAKIREMDQGGDDPRSRSEELLDKLDTIIELLRDLGTLG